MWYLLLMDGPLPIGDIIFGVGCVICVIAILELPTFRYDNVFTSIPIITDNADIDISTGQSEESANTPQVNCVSPHRTTKNGSKNRTNDKHTKKRPGSQKDKAKSGKKWQYRGNKRNGPVDMTE